MSSKNASKKKPKKIVRGVDVPYANQYLPDPRKQLCWDSYINPKSPTFGNALQSAVTAGYSEATAKHITKENWWHEKTRRLSMLSKAERNLEEALDLPIMTQAMGAFGPLFKMKEEKRTDRKGNVKTVRVPMLNKPIMVHNVGLLGLRTNTATFVAERIGKAVYGRKESEGGDTYNLIVFANDVLKRVAARTLGGGDDGSPASAAASN